MKKKILIISAVVLAVALLAIASVGAFFDMEKPLAVMSGLVGIGDMPGYADANGDGTVNVLDVLYLMREQKTVGLRAQSITLDDDNYTLAFEENKFSYTVKLPAGRPTIPQVSATVSEGVELEVLQAYIPDGKTSGTASVIVSKNGFSNTYTINFVRDISNGFVLQYDDRYEFVPSQEGDYTFTSSNDEIVSVDGNGVMTANKVSNESVTITATSANKTETLVVDRVEKAHINLFFVTGQSNGQGCYDGVTVNGEGTLENPNQIFYDEQLATVVRPDEKGRVYSFDVHPRSENIKFYNYDPAFKENVIYDMHDFARQGFASPLGVDWYDYTGEKVIFLQSAWSGSAIEAWINPETHPTEAGKYSSRKLNFYETTKEGYNKLIPMLEENYEILRTMNFWLQGETATNAVYDKNKGDYHFSDEPTFDSSKLMTDETYYKYFKWIDEDMRREMGLDYNSILSIRSHGAKTRQTIVPIISAHFALCNENDDIFLAMRKVMEITRQYVDPDKTSDGWNFMGTDNNHYNQIGYNRIGIECAENAFKFAFYSRNAKATDIEIIDNNGKTRLEDNATLEIQAGTVYRLGVLSLPHYTSERVTWTSTDETIASADMYNAIYAKRAGRATLTVTTESGKSKSINVVVYEIDTQKVEYRWNFTDLTSEVGDNNLTLSDASKALGLSNGYTLTGGIYKNNSSTASKRPDFKADKAMYVDSLHNWSIEWASALNSNSILLGPDAPDHTNADEIKGYIYLSNGAYKKIKIVPETGAAIYLDYVDYLDKTTEMNSWRIEYTAADKTFKLLVSLDEGATWNTVSTAPTGDFSATFTNIFGRPFGTGKTAFTGQCDYIEINCHSATKVYERALSPTYRWDFDDLTATVGDNDLSLSEATLHVGADKYFKLKDGMYSLDYAEVSGSYNKYPDLTLENPFNLSYEKDWEIQWRGRNDDDGNGKTRPGVLMGGTTTGYEASDSIRGFFYLAPATDFDSSADGILYPIKFDYYYGESTKAYKLLDYGEYSYAADEMNDWKIAYDAETKTVSLYYSANGGGIWSLCSTTVVTKFDIEITTLFGRIYGNGKYNFVGEMDYIQVSLGE